MIVQSLGGALSLGSQPPRSSVGSTMSQNATSEYVRRDDRPRRVMIRLAAFLIAAIPLGLLGLAGALEPDSSGLGTHQQLGLPPCSMRFLLGIRCPACGMTTSWAHFTRGQLWQSAQVNAGGFLLAGYSLLVVFLSLGSLWSGRLPSPRTQLFLTLALIGIVVVTVMDWLMRLIG